MTDRVVRLQSQPTPIGELTIFEGPKGVLAVARGTKDADSAYERIEALGARFEEADGLDAATELAAYFRGDLTQFRSPVDLSLTTGFRRRALRALVRVPFGQLVTYGELARRAGSPGGARAIGGAMRHNPIPFIVPCHRVVAADGTLGGFTGGLDVKRHLHALEGIEARTGGWPTRSKRAS